MLNKKLLATQKPVSGDIAEGVSFDGTNDYLSRSTDLVGNVDSKTFTLSCWLYVTKNSSYFYSNDDTVFCGFEVGITSDGKLVSFGRSANTTGTNIFSYYSTNAINKLGWNHIIISVDLSNTLNRHVYLNDVLLSGSFGFYNNSNIKFTNSIHSVGKWYNSTKLKGRLAHLYLDYTYRDLSIEASRRLFITEDLKPADNQAALNPILYLPIRDADTAHINEGTGGDFIPNGVLDTAQRGANQWNCVASEFDGVGDYLSSTGIGASDGRMFTFSCDFVTNVYEDSYIINFRTPSLFNSFNVSIDDGGKNIWIDAQNTSGTRILEVRTPLNSLILNKTNSLQVSVDLTSSSNRSLIINGNVVPASWNIYTNEAVDFTIPDYYIGSGTSSFGKWNGSLGELYFDTTYIDLATNNPFWDEDTQKPKPVLQVLEETGNTPLIAMPIRADNAGKNYGTGGDFTVNSGPFVGARGASEFWARSVGGATGYLGSAGIGQSTDSSVVTFVCAMKTPTATGNDVFFSIDNDLGTSNSFYAVFTSSSTIRIAGRNSTATNVYTRDSSAVSLNTWYLILFSCDLSTGVDDFYLANISQPAATLKTVGESFGFSSGDLAKVGGFYGGASLDASQYVGYGYFSTSYIDFSQEENRNLFVDQLGYPKDLSKQIADGLIPEPLIYMPFDDPNNLGKNLGTGGDFTVNGTVTQGSDVDPNP